MKTIKIIDTTLRSPDCRDGAQLSFKEKLETARILDSLKVDVIELAPVGTTKADLLSNKTVAGSVKAGVTGTVEIGSGLIEETWEAIRSAKYPRLNLLVPVSTVQMEYACHMKAPKMIAAIEEQIKLCRFLSEKVEFSAVDATRADFEFLVQAIKTAIAAGANRITVCDNAGVMLPDEFAKLISDLKAHIPELEETGIYVEVNSEMGLALAVSAAAVAAGATGIKCAAITGVLPTLEQTSKLISKKGADIGAVCELKTTDLNRSVAQIEKICKPVKTTDNAYESVLTGDAAGVTLDKTDEISEVIKVINQMGYDLSEEDYAKVYEEFKRVAEKKHYIGTKEIDAIIASTAMQVPSTFKLDNFVINSGNIISATANVLIDKNGEKLRGVGVGDGPVDAAFLAIEQIIGHHYELDDFQVQTITEGRDAMGSAIVKLRSEGRIYSGSGISTDIIGASIRAYISALNKIAFEENQ